MILLPFRVSAQALKDAAEFTGVRGVDTLLG
jgi:hypothetical protein